MSVPEKWGDGWLPSAHRRSTDYHHSDAIFIIPSHNPLECGEWEVRYAGMSYRPYAADTVPSAMQRFLAKWLLGVVWIKLE
jgi:hypothetical protein